MDFAALETAITAWVESLSTLPVVWGSESSKRLPKAYVHLTLGTISQEGTDEVIWSYDSQADATRVMMTGVRTLILSVSFRTRDQGLGGSARQYSENFRTRIYSPASIEALSAAGLSYTSSSDLRAGDYQGNHDRLISQVVLDLTFQARFSELDPVYDGGYFDTVEIQEEDYIYANDGAFIIDEDGAYVTGEQSPLLIVSAA